MALLHIRDNMAKSEPKLNFYEDVLIGPTDTSGTRGFTNANPRLRTRKRGKIAGALVRLKRRRHRTPLPSILLGNVRSLVNKRDELSILINSRRVIADCSVLGFTETWLSASIPDSAVQQDGFSLHRADRTEASQKTKGGGVCFHVNQRWCTDTTVISQTCSTVLETLSIKCRPFQGTSPPSYSSLSTYLPKLQKWRRPNNFLVS